MKKKQRVTVLRLSNVLSGTGAAVLAVGIGILFLTFGPLATQELRYTVHAIPKDIVPIDKEFGIVIPKLGANARVIANVDPYDGKAYQYALTKGVAHARGTSVPGAIGNIFLFAHSSENFYDALQYNSVFYLINKLEDGDKIYLYYHDNKFVYTVTGKKFVNSKDVSYLRGESLKVTLTLMTCWPPGTNSKRLLIFASL
jgi:sortase A